jgi:hypothetical protein
MMVPRSASHTPAIPEIGHGEYRRFQGVFQEMGHHDGEFFNLVASRPAWLRGGGKCYDSDFRKQ